MQRPRLGNLLGKSDGENMASLDCTFWHGLFATPQQWGLETFIVSFFLLPSSPSPASLLVFKGYWEEGLEYSSPLLV